MSTSNAIRRAVRCALVEQSRLGAAMLGCTLLLATASAGAQNAPADDNAAAESEKLTEVVVVGSRIRRDTFNAPSPVQVVNREETTMAGFSSVGEALQSTAVTTGAAQINNAFGGFVTDGGPGANTLSLRGLGAGRTLVMINGRRIAPAGTRGAIGSADLNVLPTAITDRVEILRDGASSIYGSDAIAGVVNVITMKPDGFTVDGQYDVPTEGEGAETRMSIVGGLKVSAGTSRERWSIASAKT